MMREYDLGEHLGKAKYLHCGSCWRVLGKIPSGSKMEFDTYDCAWECKVCGRLNLDNDGLTEKTDRDGCSHLFYHRGEEEGARVSAISDGFDFDKIEEL